MKARKAGFAGSWYPDSASGCERQINEFIKEAKTISGIKPVGGIVPHAGWYYSGKIACNVIKILSESGTPDVMLVFGMHLHAGSSRFLMKEGAWDTPFGEIEIEDRIAARLYEKYSFEIETAQRFNRDNTIELQLPFIKYFFKDVKIIPMGVPPVEESLNIGISAVKIAKDLGLKVMVLGSTDLTHYGANYGFVSHGTGVQALKWVKNENDKRVIDAMLEMNPGKVIKEAMSNDNACCAGAAATAISAAKQLGASRAELVTYTTSYDISPGDSFVGYAGIVF
ncbi:MAG: AmmeMemoRadiSam system protein B [Desulfobacteraceae bacterium]|nr:MAG: AmmeMemoRadiSam system protein B [Desulfobacteraceae bacterium]